jgi:hypothetical protein
MKRKRTRESPRLFPPACDAAAEGRYWFFRQNLAARFPGAAALKMVFQVSRPANSQTRTIVGTGGHPTWGSSRLFVDSKCHTDTIKQGRETSSAANHGLQRADSSPHARPRFARSSGCSPRHPKNLIVHSNTCTATSDNKFELRTVAYCSAAIMRNC